MPRLKKIILYTLHEYEHATAQQVLTDIQSTDGFSIGLISEDNLKRIQNEGLVYQEIKGDDFTQQTGFETKASSKDPNIIFTKKNKALFNSKIVKAGTDDPGEIANYIFPGYYILFINQPLLEIHKTQLEKLQAEIIQFAPTSSYLVRLKTNVIAQLQALDFVTGIKYYSAADTYIEEFSDHSVELTANAIRLVPFDILVHKPEDTRQFLVFLRNFDVPIIGYAKKKIRIGIDPASELLSLLAGHPLVRKIEEYIPPKLSNDISRQILGFETQNSPTVINIPYTGKAELIAIADTGIDDQHQDLRNQIHSIVALGRVNNHTDPHGHGTHVAGSVVGDGTASNGSIRGTAPGAKIFFQSILDSKGELGGLPLSLEDLFQQAYDAGARIHNNSWGAATGSKYTVNSEEVDEFVHSHKDMLILIAAGNEGTGSNPQNVQQGFVDLLSIGSPASSKNALTVGASRSSRTTGGYSQSTYSAEWPTQFPFPPVSTDTVSGDIQGLAGFSSRGPCDDLRIKPDLVAPGTDIASTKSSLAPLRNFWGKYPNSTDYAFMGGTSMATPLVAGCAAAVREYYLKVPGHSPSAALLKATLINGSIPLTGLDALSSHPMLPNNDQGFGCLSMLHTLPNTANPFKLDFYDNWQNSSEHFLQTGQQHRFQIKLQATSWVKICMAYTDYPARSLQNNLNLLMDSSQPNIPKWRGNQDAKQPLVMLDATNNVEIIRLTNLSPGTYTIAVTASNLLHGPQDYALAISSNDQSFQFIKL